MTGSLRAMHQKVAGAKSRAVSRDISGAVELLASASDPEVLTVVREQKLLLQVRDAGDRTILADEYCRAARRVYGSGSRVQEAANYVGYLDIVQRCFATLAEDIEATRRLMPPCTPDESFELAHLFIMDFARDYYSGYLDVCRRLALANENGHPGQSSAACESVLHELNGRLNDGAWAAARALNACGASVRPARRTGRRRGPPKLAQSAFLDLVRCASKWEVVDGMLDRVSFGEWTVDHVDQSSTPTVTFGLADPTLLLARTVGIKRQVVWRSYDRPRVDRFLRAMLRPAIPVFISAFLPALAPPGRELTGDRLSSLHHGMERVVDQLDAEDDLLVAAAKGDLTVQAEYLGAVGVRWYAILARNVSGPAGGSFLRADFPEVPVHRIARVLGRTDAEVVAIQRAIRRQAKALPVKHRREMQRHPLFVLPDKSLRFLITLDGGVWPAAIRSALIDGMGMGNRYGKLWEQFIADNFRGVGWDVVGRGIKVRDGGRILTDIDLLVAKDDLVLACQIKAMAGTGEDGYAHWKNRQTVLEGVRQSKVVMEALRRRPDLLDGALGKRSRGRPVDVQPVVITNLHTFNGWKAESVPVVSTGGLMTLFRGARVDYYRTRGETKELVLRESHIVGSEPTTEEFLRLMRTPIEWQTASETAEIEYRSDDVAGARFRFPELRHRLEITMPAMTPDPE